jgi:hypothetical protein
MLIRPPAARQAKSGGAGVLHPLPAAALANSPDAQGEAY